MSTMRPYVEDSLGLSNINESGLIKSFTKMKNALKAVGEDPFKNVSSICKNPQTLSLLTEAIKFSGDDISATTSKYKAEDMSRLNTMYENVAQSLMNEAIQAVGDLSPIMMNSFGIQERALISAHLPRAVKQVVAKIDNFKLTERIPYIIDLTGTKRKFLDAFVPNEKGESSSLSLKSSFTVALPVPSAGVCLYENADYNSTIKNPSISTNEIFGFDSAFVGVVKGTITAPSGDTPGKLPTLDGGYYEFKNDVTDGKGAGIVITKFVPPQDTSGSEPVPAYPDGAYDAQNPKSNVTIGMESLINPNVETGTFNVVLNWKTYAKSGTDWTTTAHSAVVQGQFDMSDGKLLSLTTTDPNNIQFALFNFVLSPETHIRALSVSYDMKHTPVNIPIGEHFEYALSEEFKDASDKYYNIDAMALLSDYMGKAVEQVKDIKTLEYYQELAKGAVVKATFNCTPTTGFAQGKEEYIRREFHPFMEKICILLKNKVRIPQCHFRVVGNPLDIRLGAAAGVEYIYKRNEQFAGEISIDYEFSVTSDVHKIFYLSSERVPQGQVLVFLIPNTIEDNISTVNHYEYATYVSNRYKGTKTNVPTVMISTRYLTKAYYPVVAAINIVNNIVENDITAPIAADYASGLYGHLYDKVNYVNG